MSAFVLNITFDCHEPLTLARFWADATGYRPDGEPARGTARIRLTNPDPRGVKHLVFRRVPDPTPGKARIHLDLASRDPGTEILRLLELGATLVDRPGSDGRPVWRTDADKRWVVMRGLATPPAGQAQREP